MTEYRTRITKMTVAPLGEPVFSEMSTHIEIEDEPCGSSCVVLSQEWGDGISHTVSVSANEWPAIRAAINRMMREIGYENPDV